MYILVILICTFIFIGWLFYESRKARKTEQTATQEFWAREEEANRTRKKDISHLPLLTIDESEIPAAVTSDDAIIHCIGQIRKQIKEPMIDLSKYSNTDLKLAYGVGNFKTLSDYDENFNNFLISLSNLARIYTDSGFFEEARDTYLLALRYGSMKIADYTELAKLYLKMDQPGKISDMITEIEAGDHPRKNSIADMLREVLASYR